MTTNVIFKHILRYQKKKLGEWLASSPKLNIFSRRSYFGNYISLFYHSQLINGLIIWNSTYPSYLKKLAVLQNRAILQVVGGNRYQRLTPFFVLLDKLKLVDLFILETAKFMHKFMHNELPSSFFNYFIKTFNISSRITRTSSSSNNLYIPKFTSTRLQRCIKYHCVKTWNSIPTEIQKLCSTKFIIEYKSYLASYYK